MQDFRFTAVVDVRAIDQTEARQYLQGVLEVGDDVDADPGSKVTRWEIHDEDLLSEDRHQAYVVGTAVTFRHIERYPHFIIPAGTTGTVTYFDGDLLRVLCDDHIDGAEEWDNEVIWQLSNGDEPERDFVLHEIGAPPVEAPEQIYCEMCLQDDDRENVEVSRILTVEFTHHPEYRPTQVRRYCEYHADRLVETAARVDGINLRIMSDERLDLGLGSLPPGPVEHAVEGVEDPVVALRRQFGQYPQQVGVEDGTEDDFGDLQAEAARILGIEFETADDTGRGIWLDGDWQRWQDITVDIQAKDWLGWLREAEQKWHGTWQSEKALSPERRRAATALTENLPDSLPYVVTESDIHECLRVCLEHAAEFAKLIREEQQS